MFHLDGFKTSSDQGFNNWIDNLAQTNLTFLQSLKDCLQTITAQDLGRVVVSFHEDDELLLQKGLNLLETQFKGLGIGVELLRVSTVDQLKEQLKRCERFLIVLATKQYAEFSENSKVGTQQGDSEVQKLFKDLAKRRGGDALQILLCEGSFVDVGFKVGDPSFLIRSSQSLFNETNPLALGKDKIQPLVCFF